ncbi:MAG: dihydropyrimidinase [Treponema sp.]|jgi:dihydropyrimidinase|nr:dihydropyrimidinase [Treponema sp.]
MKDLLIKGGLVVSETDEAVRDILVREGTIVSIAPTIVAQGDCETVDARGKFVLPGGVDAHTHLTLDVGFATVSDDFYTGTVAAAFGGTTTIIDHPGFGPAGCALEHQIRKYHALAQGKAVVDYGFHGVIQHVDETVLADMAALTDEGITSYKVYLTYDYKIADGDVFRVLERARTLGCVITVHPENDGVIQHLRERFKREGSLTPHYHPRSRPAECEAEAINRMILFAHLAGDAPLYIVHLSNALGLSFINAAKARGQGNLYTETCPQYLFLDDSRYELPDNEGLKFIMCPPLRTRADRDRLMAALVSEIDTVATDHCPFLFKTQKMLGKDDFMKCPSGAPGIEERLPLLFSEGVMKKQITLRRFVDLCAANPARLFGIYPQKGVIKEGSDADIVIIDPTKQQTLSSATLHANVDYSAYEGMVVQGVFERVISRGETLVKDGAFLGTPGRGRFLKRKSFYAR